VHYIDVTGEPYAPAALTPTPVHNVGPTAGLNDLGKTETFRPLSKTDT